MKRLLLLVTTCLFPLIAFSQNSSLLKDAQDLFAAGNYSSAVIKFQEAMNKLSGRERNIAQLQLSTAKTCVEALNKAQAAVSTKNYDTAIAEYQKVLDANPNDTRVKGLQEDARRSKNQELNPTLTVSKNTLSFSSSSGSQKITVNCNTSWILVDQSSSMCTVSRSGNEITVACSANNSTTSRNTSFIVRTTNGAKEQRVSVSQVGRSSTSTSSNSSSSTSTVGKLTVKPTSISLSSGSGVAIVDVLANGRDYEVSLLPSWAKVKTKYGTWFSLSYTENPYSTARSDWFNVKAGGETVRVSITQSGNPSKSSSSAASYSSTRLTVKQTDITLPSSSGTTMIDVSTNAKDYEVILLPSWIKLKSKYDSFFSLTYSENNSSSSRSDWFNVKAGGKTVRVDVTQKGKNNYYPDSYGSNRNRKESTSSNKTFTLGFDVSLDYFDSYNYSNHYDYYETYDYRYPISYGVGLRARIGRFDQLINLIGGIRYVSGNGEVGLMAPVFLNMNLIRHDLLSLYIGGGYEFSCLDTNTYYNDWIIQGGFLFGPHTDLQLFYKPDLKVMGAGFTYYF